MKKAIFIMYLLYNIVSYGYINIYPTTFDKRIDGSGEIQEYTITNTTDKVIKYRIYTEDGSESDTSMREWMDIYPESLLLKPGDEGQIRVYINSSEGAKEGEYSAILGIKEVTVPSTNKKSDKLLEVFSNVKMKIYGYVGELPTNFNFNDVKAKESRDGKLFLSGDIQNNSGRRVDIEILFVSDNNRYMLSEKRFRKGEIVDLSTLNLDTNILKNKKLNSGNLEIVDKKTKEILQVISIEK